MGSNTYITRVLTTIHVSITELEDIEDHWVARVDKKEVVVRPLSMTGWRHKTAAIIMMTPM